MNEIAMKFQTFETYYVYVSDEPVMRVLLLPMLPCMSCGEKGTMFVTATCVLCGDTFSAVFCADAYSTANKSETDRVGELRVSDDVPICNSCRAFRDALLHARKILESPPSELN